LSYVGKLFLSYYLIAFCDVML